MENCFFFIICFPLVLLLLNNVKLTSSTTILNSIEQNALLAFKDGITSDPTGVLTTNWSANTSVCSWTGVSCSLHHQRITALNLSDLNLGGTIAPHLGNLTFLRSLDLSSNNFSGNLPFQLSQLRRLEEMKVGFNNLIGDIPSWFGDLSELRHLHLNNNSFSGGVPLPLFNVSRLQTLNIGYNLVGGNISEQIQKLVSLEILNLAGNEFVGPIPSVVLSNMSILTEIDVSRNQLSGELPNDMCSGIAPRLRRLDLTKNKLDGQIPTGIYKCAKLENLSLSDNQFSGNIPTQIGNLTVLRYLSSYSNNLQGNLPSSIFNISSLEFVKLNKNSLSGSIPTFYNSPKLKALYLSINKFTGSIPKQVGNLTSLVVLDFSYNKLTGELPEEVANLASLETFGASSNYFLNGSIPSPIFNISKLKKLGLQENQFSGTLPSDMGLYLINLEKLYLFQNKLIGEIPTHITNASKLTMVELYNNSFSGFIPDFGNLRFLQALRLWNNNLSGAESPTQELRFLSSLTDCRDLKVLEIFNNPLMNGVLPTSIGNLSTSLVTFWASNCSIRGVIPSEIGNLRNLQHLELSKNQLTGTIPTTIGELKQVVKLKLSENHLRGSIPDDLCQMTKLEMVYLDGNMIENSIPECLGETQALKRVSFTSNKLNSTLPSNLLSLADLIFLDLSSNYLTGQLPDQIGRLKAVNVLDLSYNSFSGKIPNSMEGCKSLEFLYLSNNKFDGAIPQSLGEVKGLRELNLSNNDLSGFIPKSLENLDLEKFNVSYNRLEGEIPDKGCFTKFNAQSFLHNSALCGAPRFRLGPCKYNGRSTYLVMKYIVPPFVAFMILVATMIVVIRRCRQQNIPPIVEIPPPNHGWKIISEEELSQGTSSFSEINLLGKGSVGSVYLATLPDGDVAVKVFNLKVQGATKIFETESQILSTIRHRNLLKVLGYCSHTQFKALVLEYMPNGSLDKWLHSAKFFLDLVERLKIAIDVAFGLEYLHHGHTNTVVHCDIKPSNVLLDADMTAHVADFGIAKLFNDDEAEVQTRNMATIGYAAPEFGEGRISTGGDVYSYGILLLEMFTSKRPTDDMFDANLSIKVWVEKALRENTINEVVAPGLISNDDAHFGAKLQSVSSIFELAMKCLAISARERINMMDVVAALQKIKVPVQEAMNKHRG